MRRPTPGENRPVVETGAPARPPPLVASSWPCGWGQALWGLRSCVPHRAWPLATGTYLSWGCPPPRGCWEQVTANWGDTKAQPSRLCLGYLCSPCSRALCRMVEVSVETTLWSTLFLCPVLPSSLPYRCMPQSTPSHRSKLHAAFITENISKELNLKDIIVEFLEVISEF